MHYPDDGAMHLAGVEREHFWFAERRALVWDVLRRAGVAARIAGGETVEAVDVGCGTGFTAAWLSRRGLPTVGLDANANFSADAARAADLLAGDITAVEPAAEFDCLLLLDTLEHLPDDVAFLRHAAKALRRRGIVVITVPAFAWLWTDADDYAGHLRRYTKRTLRGMLGVALPGARVLELRYFYGSVLPLYLLRKIVPSRLARTLWRTELALPAFANAVLGAIVRAERRITGARGAPAGTSLVACVRLP